MSTTTWDGSEALSLHESGQSTQLIDGQVEGSEIRPLGWRGGRTESVSTEPNTRSDALSGFEMPPSAPASDVAGPEPEEAEADPCFRITDAGVEWSPIEPGAPPDYAAPTHLLLCQAVDAHSHTRGSPGLGPSSLTPAHRLDTTLAHRLDAGPSGGLPPHGGVQNPACTAALRRVRRRRQHDQRLARWPEVKLARLAAGLEV